MFDVDKVAKRIREARINKNMTQNRLADELGVSYQAVSNWERGNSMPDISKYEDLCRILEVNLEFLLGFSSCTNTVNKLLKDTGKKATEAVSFVELMQVAPMMPPKELGNIAKAVSHGSMEQLMELTPFLGSSVLAELVEVWNITNDINMKTLMMLAPFLDVDALDKLADYVTEATVEELIGLASFCDSDTLDKLADYVTEATVEELIGLAPFCDSDTLTVLFNKIDKINGISVEEIMGLLPFMDMECLEQAADVIRVESLEDVIALTPWFSGEALERIAKSRKNAGV